jgi:hypothetical protein
MVATSVTLAFPNWPKSEDGLSYSTQVFSLVLVDEQPERGIEARPNVVLRHLDCEERIAEEVLDRFLGLADKAEECSVVAGPKEHEAARPGHPLEPGPDGFGVGPAS